MHAFRHGRFDGALAAPSQLQCPAATLPPIRCLSARTLWPAGKFRSARRFAATQLPQRRPCSSAAVLRRFCMRYTSGAPAANPVSLSLGALPPRCQYTGDRAHLELGRVAMHAFRHGRSDGAMAAPTASLAFGALPLPPHQMRFATGALAVPEVSLSSALCRHAAAPATTVLVSGWAATLLYAFHHGRSGRPRNYAQPRRLATTLPTNWRPCSS